MSVDLVIANLAEENRLLRRILMLESALRAILDHPHICRNWEGADVMVQAREILENQKVSKI